MADRQEPQTYIKRKNKPGAIIGFRTSKFFRGQSFSPGGIKPGAKFNPSTFTPKAQAMRQTQHKG